MIVGNHRVGTLIEVFNNHEAACEAVRELKAVGFTDAQIGIVFHPDHVETRVHSGESELSKGARAGTAAGIGIGALWSLGVLTGTVPDLGPIIGGGALGVFLSATAAGSTAGALIRIHTPQSDSYPQKNHLIPAHTIVTVRAGTRADIACSILNQFNRPERFVAQSM